MLPEICEIKDKNHNNIKEEENLKDTELNYLVSNDNINIKNDSQYENEFEKTTIDSKNEINSNDFNELKQNLNDQIKDNKTTVLNYLIVQKEKYKKLDIKVPILEYVIQSGRSFNYENIASYKNFNSEKNLNDKILTILLNNLKLNNICNINEYGYFCYKYNDEWIEALYSSIDPEILYNYIINEKEADDYNEPNKELQRQYFKSRAMGFEYYINKSIFIKKYGMKPLPRIVFPLKKVYDIKDNKITYEKNNYRNFEEIDGSFFISRQFSLETKDFPFIFQFNKKYSFKSKNVMNILGSDDNKNNPNNNFEEDDLCIFEIKNQFPNKHNNEKTDNEKQKSFEEILKIMLIRLVIFEQLYKELGVKYKNIKLILFYDVVKKDGYQDIIKDEFQKFFSNKVGKNKIKYANRIFFQVVYINSSYLAESLKSSSDEIDNLKYQMDNAKKENKELKIQMDELNIKMDNVNNENKNLKYHMDEINIKMDNVNKENNNLKYQLDNVNNENKNLKNQMDNVNNENKNLKNQMDELNIKMDNVNKENKELNAKVTNLNNEFRNLINEIKLIREINSNQQNEGKKGPTQGNI